MSKKEYSKPELYQSAITTLLNVHNEQRKAHGLEILQLDAELCKPAQWMAQHMADKGFMAHTDKQGRGVWDRVKQLCSYQSATLGENVAVGYTPEGVVNGWMGSPGHRKNILNPVFNIIGVGYFYKSFAEEKADADSFDFCDYYCIVFGKK